MKITNIKQSDDIFTVTKTPNRFEKIFGAVEKEEKYKQLNSVYKNYNYLIAFQKENGDIAHPIKDKTVEALNRHIKKF